MITKSIVNTRNCIVSTMFHLFPTTDSGQAETGPRAMEQPMPAPNQQHPGDTSGQIKSDKPDIQPEAETSPKNKEQKQENILDLVGDMKQFTGNKTIMWDKSVTNARDQATIQSLGCYVSNVKAELPEPIKKNIEATVERIRGRGA